MIILNLKLLLCEDCQEDEDKLHIRRKELQTAYATVVSYL